MNQEDFERFRIANWLKCRKFSLETRYAYFSNLKCFEYKNGKSSRFIFLLAAVCSLYAVFICKNRSDQMYVGQFQNDSVPLTR